MHRDTYHDWLTYQDMANVRRCAAPGNILEGTVDALVKRSGAANVKSGVLRSWGNEYDMTVRFAVHFDSRAWTGRGAYEPRGRRSFTWKVVWYIRRSLVVGLRIATCRHYWNMRDNSCDGCGLSREEYEDFSWRFPSKKSVVLI